MFRGGILPGFTLAYETWGTLNAERSNAALIFTGLSPDAHAASAALDSTPGWWEPIVGEGKPLDSSELFIICINSLGSCKGSTGPDSPQPGSERPWRLRFPELSIEDIANSAALLLEDLNIGKLQVLVGPSMGGMSAMAFIKHHPNRARHFLTISSAMAAEPFAIAIRSLQREAITADRDFNSGEYSPQRWPRTGLRFARKLGMMTYRSAQEWSQRFGRERQDRYPGAIHGMTFQVESYLEAAAERFIGQFDPVSYIYLSRAMDWFDLSQDEDSSVGVFSRSGLESACVIGVETDILFPIQQQKRIAKDLINAGVQVEFHSLSSIQGHDAFLVDYERFSPIIFEYIKTISR